MAIKPLNTIKDWFRTAKKPTQGQFWDTWDSFWHKMEKIKIEAIDGLQSILNNKVDVSQFDGHVNNTDNPHKVKVEQVEGAVTIEEHNIAEQNLINVDKYLQEQIDELSQKGNNSDTNIGNSDITQTDELRTWNIAHKQLNIEGEGGRVEMQIGELTQRMDNNWIESRKINVSSQDIYIENDRIEINSWGYPKIRFMYGEVSNTFLWIDYNNKLNFLSLEEFKEKLGL